MGGRRHEEHSSKAGKAARGRPRTTPSRSRLSVGLSHPRGPGSPSPCSPSGHTEAPATCPTRWSAGRPVKGRCSRPRRCVSPAWGPGSLHCFSLSSALGWHPLRAAVLRDTGHWLQIETSGRLCLEKEITTS